METKNVLLFIAGLILGVASTLIYCEYSRDEGNEFAEGQIQINYINQEEAVSQRNNYTATFGNDPINGYNISYQQLIAIDSTLKKMSPDEIRRTSGFRMYKGLASSDPRSQVSYIVYSIDNNLKARIPKEVYAVTGFDDKFILPCPDFCD